MADSLLATDEGVILDEREAQRSRLARQTWAEVLATERLSWLRDGRFQRGEVAKKQVLADLFHDEIVEEQDLSQAEVPH